MHRRIPFDAAWGFDSQGEHTGQKTDVSFHVIEGDALSLHDDDGEHHHDRRLFEPLPLDMGPTFEVLRPDDEAYPDETGDNVSTMSGASGLHSLPLWSVPPHVLSKSSESDRRAPPGTESHEITSTSSHSAEIIEEVDPLAFGPRGTQAMMTFMRRSEETRMEIIGNLRSLPIDSAVALDTNIMHFFKTKESRERLMSCFKRGSQRHDNSSKKRRRDTFVSQSESDL